MTKVDVRVNKVTPDVRLPRYQTRGSAGFDIEAYIGVGEGQLVNGKWSVIVEPGQRELVGTGLRFQIPLGHEIQLRPRSGLALNHGISLTNSPATIDSDFTGEVKVILENRGTTPFVVADGDRICQGVLAEVPQANFVVVDKIENTERGVGGFGSTGVNV